MTRLVDSIVAALNSREESRLRDVHDLPRYMAQLYVIHKEGSQSIHELEESGFPYLDTLRSQIPTHSGASKLKQALTDYVSEPDGDYVPTALWTLGYFFDPDLVGFLRKQLRVHLDRGQPSEAALGQCIIALDTLGEDILSDGSFAAHETERNRRMAEHYLDR